jgi:hypothetical protein
MEVTYLSVTLVSLKRLCGATAHNTTFWRFWFPSDATRCVCFSYEVFWRSVHIAHLVTPWLLVRLRFRHTHVTHFHETAVSADLYGCEIWVAKDVDKKINWVYEIRFVKYDDGEWILDAAKDVRRDLNIYEWSKRTRYKMQLDLSCWKNRRWSVWKTVFRIKT